MMNAKDRLEFKARASEASGEIFQLICLCGKNPCLDQPLIKALDLLELALIRMDYQEWYKAGESLDYLNKATAIKYY